MDINLREEAATRYSNSLQAMFLSVSVFLLTLLIQPLHLQGTCTTGALRLADGSPSEGRVELCYRGIWGTVCDDAWDINDTLVACRQLGLATGYGVDINLFGIGTGPILLDDVQCAGNESSLFQCPHAGVQNHNCRHTEDAAVKCLRRQECNDMDINLIAGSSPNSGRVEVCYNGVWGTICYDNWGFSDIRVVCRELGLPTVYLVRYHLPYSDTRPLLLYDVQCNGSEKHLFECPHVGENIIECGYYVASVKCLSGPECSEPDIRLVNNSTEYDGTVQVCHDGFWGSVCGDIWDDIDASVACRQLGLPSLGAVGGVDLTFSSKHPIVLDSVTCSGSEERLTDCVHAGVGFHSCVLRDGEATLLCRDNSKAATWGGTTGGIIGGIFGVILALFVLCVLCFFCYKRHQPSTATSTMHSQQPATPAVPIEPPAAQTSAFTALNDLRRDFVPLQSEPQPTPLQLQMYNADPPPSYPGTGCSVYPALPQVPVPHYDIQKVMETTRKDF